jgi:hypothetical protein
MMELPNELFANEKATLALNVLLMSLFLLEALNAMLPDCEGWPIVLFSMRLPHACSASINQPP